MCKKFLKSGKKTKSKPSCKTWACLGKTKMWSVLTLILIIITGLGYLGIVNYKATIGFKIAALEKKIDNLKEVNQKIQMEKIELEKVSRIQEAAVGINMVVADKMEYLETGEEGLALR